MQGAKKPVSKRTPQFLYPLVEILLAAIGFFYGTPNQEHCGRGMTIVINNDHFLYICGGLGQTLKLNFQVYKRFYLLFLILVLQTSIYMEIQRLL